MDFMTATSPLSPTQTTVGLRPLFPPTDAMVAHQGHGVERTALRAGVRRYRERHWNISWIFELAQIGARLPRISWADRVRGLQIQAVQGNKPVRLEWSFPFRAT
jgi:hypothetical protein